MGEFTHAMRNPIKERDDRIAMLEAKLVDYDLKFAEAAVALNEAGVKDWEAVPDAPPGDVRYLSLAERIKKLKTVCTEDEEFMNRALNEARRQGHLKARELTNTAYTERNRLAVLLAHTAFLRGWKAGRATDPEEPLFWQNVVIVNLPTGQVSWHIGQDDIEATGFRTLPKYNGEWDGHTSHEKWGRVQRYINELTEGF